MGKAIVINGNFTNLSIGKVTFIEDLKLLESLSISGGNVTDLLIGETTQLTAVLTPAGTTQTNIEWSVSDEAIATVDSNGLVTCKGAGELRVTVQSLDNPAIHAEKEILCVASRPITGISITGESNGIIDDTIQLTATLTPSNTTETGILWESDNNTIAEVTQSGLVTLQSVGTVKITATSLSNELVYDELIITVAAEAIPIESITVNGTTPIEVGNTEQFSVIYNPNDTTEVGVVWTSSNQNVATVNSSGWVTAIGAGTATIMATSIHRQVVAGTQVVTIIPQVIAITGLSITGGNAVDNGSTLQLGIAYTPSNTTQQGVVWTSSNQNIATVNSSGLVTAIAEGAVVITATSTINGAISDTITVAVTAASAELPTATVEYLSQDYVNGDSVWGANIGAINAMIDTAVVSKNSITGFLDIDVDINSTYGGLFASFDTKITAPALWSIYVEGLFNIELNPNAALNSIIHLMRSSSAMTSQAININNQIYSDHTVFGARITGSNTLFNLESNIPAVNKILIVRSEANLFTIYTSSSNQIYSKSFAVDNTITINDWLQSTRLAISFALKNSSTVFCKNSYDKIRFYNYALNSEQISSLIS